MNNLINKISNIADRFAVAEGHTEQRKLMESFINSAQAAIAHPGCPPDYRTWLRSVLPQFQSDLKRITEIDMMYDN